MCVHVLSPLHKYTSLIYRKTTPSTHRIQYICRTSYIVYIYYASGRNHNFLFKPKPKMARSSTLAGQLRLPQQLCVYTNIIYIRRVTILMILLAWHIIKGQRAVMPMTFVYVNQIHKPTFTDKANVEHNVPGKLTS